MNTSHAINRFQAEPEDLAWLTNREVFSLPAADMAAIQLGAAQARYAALADTIPILGRLRAEQRIDRIARIEDLAPLLIPHSTYKSYPLSVLENGRFDRLTRWLDGFTTFDLAALDASKCECIDDWIDLIDAQTDIRLVHSSGTSGKLSFLPRSDAENARVGLIGQLRHFEGFGSEPGAPAVGFEKFPVIYPSYRYGGMGQQRRIDAQVKHWHRGNGTPVVTLHPGRLSADALSIGGRLQAAEARGELGRMQIAPKLLARREEIFADHQRMPERIDNFLHELAKLRGSRVYMMGSFAQYYDIAVEGRRRGLTRLFSPDSAFVIGGGSKGRDLPDNWQDIVADFVGGTIRPAYGMSEIMAGAALCPAGRYHMQPWIVLFLLDPQSGALRPRSGVQTGRLGLFDLMASTYWGGFLTGDEVTIDWADAQTCSCGRIGPHISPQLRRYTEKEGGDDKITCAGAPQAHDKALAYVLNQA